MICSPADRVNDTEEYFFSRKLQEIARLRAHGHKVINLGIGSPDLAPDESVIEASASALRNPRNHGYGAYRSSTELRQAMSKFYDKTFDVTVNPETEVLPLLGSKEGILYLSMAYLNPGDAVLVPNPGYPAYAAVAKLIGARVIYYDLSARNNWQPDFGALEEMNLKGVKLMWVNYPHMPTGASCEAECFEKIVEFGRRNRILVCNDNPYALVLNENAPLSLLAFDKSREVALELNSLSKSFNMAGWRVGMIVGAEEAINAVLRVKSNVDSGMFTPVQVGATWALGLSPLWHAERNDIYRGRRIAAEAIFKALGFAYDPRQIGLFVWAKAPESVSDVDAYVDEILHQAHVFITPGSVFGSNGRRYARISLCAPVEVLTDALQRIQEFHQLGNLKGGRA